MNAVVIGGGLAGCEAAYQLLKRGVAVTMLEMKRIKKSPAHTLDTLCELVCSNSLKSDSADTSSGLLKAEMRLLDSLVIKCADSSKIPAGNALAVDRIKFSQAVEAELKKFPQFRPVSEVANNVETGVVTVVATGPLTDDALVPALEKIFGKGLYFFDAVAPIVTRESIDFSHAFCAGRYGKGGDDYVNCPMDKETYEQFWQQLVAAETVEVKDFENEVFEACMPIEVMAKRGINTALFGPLKPVGLTDPATGKRPYAVLQLRSENADGTLLNLVGFQTHLKFGEQKRVFSMIPALKNAEFVRYGVMHRNTYFDSPKYLGADFALKGNPELFFAGQMTGVEGYVESAASGLVAGINAAKRLQGQPPVVFPAETIIGALSNHVANSCGKFVPMNGNFGILSPFGEKIKDKNERNKRYSQRSLEAIAKIKNLL